MAAHTRIQNDNRQGERCKGHTRMQLLRALLVRPWVRMPWLRPLPLVAIVALLVARHRGDMDTLAPTRSAALASALATRGLLCTPRDVVWVHGPGGTASALASFEGRAIVRAHVGADPNDVYAVDVRLSPEGVPLELGSIYNLTRTASVDEESVHVHGDVLAYVAAAGDLRTSIHVVDLGGRDVDGYTDFTRLQKWQTALTNLQQTGQTRGVVHTVFSLDPVAAHVDLASARRRDGRGHRRRPAHRHRLRERQRAIEGAGWVRSAPEQQARPGNLVTWAVDRVRAMDFVGEERMQLVKAVAFTALDWARPRANVDLRRHDTRATSRATSGRSARTHAPRVHRPRDRLAPRAHAPAHHASPLWRGQWIALDNDPFITPIPGVPTRARHVVHSRPTRSARTRASTSRCGTRARSRSTCRRARSSR